MRLATLASMVLGVAGLAGAVAPAQAASRGEAASRAEFEFRLADASPNDPKTPLFRWAAEFKERLNKNTNGRISVRHFPSNQLGTNAQLLSAAQAGSIDFVNLSSGTMVTLEPLWRLFAIPYLVSDQKQLFRLYKARVSQEVLRSLEPKGLIGLGLHTTGPFAILNKKNPVKKPDDMKGLKLRIAPDPTTADALRALGAEPTNMNLPEVYSGIQQGVIDGLISSPIALVTGRYTEVAKHASLLGPQWVVQGFLMSARSMNKLPRDLQLAVRKTAREMQAWAERDTVNILQESLNLLQAQPGVQVTTDADGPIGPFRAKMGPVYRELAKDLGASRIAQARRAVNLSAFGVVSTAAPFRTLTSLLRRAGLDAQLNGSGPFTLFAPTDAAFKKLPKSTMTKLTRNRTYLRRVLRDHILPISISGGKLARSNRYKAKSLGGQVLSIRVQRRVVVINGKARVGRTSTTPPTLSAFNGFVHAVNNVLIR